jgi:hypothetical protein
MIEPVRLPVFKIGTMNKKKDEFMTSKAEMILLGLPWNKGM